MKHPVRPIRTLLVDPVRSLAAEGKLSWVLLITATIFSILVSNLPIAGAYLSFWKTDVGFSFLHLPIS